MTGLSAQRPHTSDGTRPTTAPRPRSTIRSIAEGTATADEPFGWQLQDHLEQKSDSETGRDVTHSIELASQKKPLGWEWPIAAFALFSRSAPAAVNAMMLGVYYISIFAGSPISGRLGSLYEQLSSAAFWLLHAALVATGGILKFLSIPRLRRELAGMREPSVAKPPLRTTSIRKNQSP